MGKKKHSDRPPSETFRNNPFQALRDVRIASRAQSETENTDAQVSASEPQTSTNEPQISTSESQGPEWPKKIVVRKEKKGRAGKTVTCISGLNAEQRQRCIKQMKKALGCGATIESEELVLLGALVDRAADWLESQGARNVVRAN